MNVDLLRQEQLGEAFRAINPHCTIPALALGDGVVLTDNAAIVAYLEAAHPAPPLLGETPYEKAEIASWNARIEMEGLSAAAEALRNSAPQMKGRALTGPFDYEQIPALAERGVARLRVFFDMLDAHLAGRAFVATDRFSLADITAVVTVDFARVVRVKASEDHIHLARWRAAMAQRRSMTA